MTEFETICYERPADKVVRIVLNRPEARNAQSVRMLYELNDAFNAAAQDDSVSVIILAANGPHFSAGHDLRDSDAVQVFTDHDRVGTWCGVGCAGAESMMAFEKEMYVGLSERWRNLPKPTIASVQGKCISGGLMLVWPCDLIVAAEDALFQDNTVSMGISGAEFFNHPFEVGARKAKEMLFTADFLTAAELHTLGMVNHVVPADELQAHTLELASKIAEKPLFALKLAKEAVNVAQDNQGRANAQQTAFAYHQLCHSHNQQVHGMLIDPGFMQKTFGEKTSS
ncbi:enoyl-CoA hydratase [Mycolicibacterium brumae]|uniref:Enoyl-CoA hydratase n=1 Tax=Mycolicibacterium brumae TaxID=85968 RepID=A0A2G5P5N6_9MYCO|nr:enoyl-CoA hydratase [Mycolicibacterium brumae]MCV7191284.1 enoyl-CoA hydratase [Mycolicibacterium brumae]PIB73214.1 enoyl-CoA hydratase [Mycolicibacterium brumae]RWA17812.1 enoyl-CoA hydratase [Mycolicibacterium brumae DSM 44177]UWW09737.1 enoyl-CoA hydratase [Mycolicibacterium brumae]